MLCRRWYLLRNWHYLKSNTLLNEIWPCIKHCPCHVSSWWSYDQLIRFIFRTQFTEGHQLWYSDICQFCESFVSLFLRHHTVHYGGNNTAYKLTTKRPHERSLFFVVVKYCKIRAKDNKNLSKKNNQIPLYLCYIQHQQHSLIFFLRNMLHDTGRFTFTSAPQFQYQKENCQASSVNSLAKEMVRKIK